MDASCLPTEVAAADADGDSDPPKLGLVKAEDEVYMELLVRVSLLLVSGDFSLEVQRHGSKMLQHLLKYRSEKLSSADLLNLTLQLVKPSSELALKSAAAVSEDAVTKTEKPMEHNKHNRSLLVLAAKNNLRSLALEKTGVEGNEECADESTTSSVFLSSGKRPLVFGDERVDFSLALDPNFESGHLSYLCYPSYSYCAPSCPKSVFSRGVFRWFGRMLTTKHKVYRIDHTLKKKNLSYSLPQDPHLHTLPFPIDGPVPISWFRLGTQSDYSNTQRRLECSANSNSSSSGKTDGSSPGKSDGSSPGKSDGSSDSRSSRSSISVKRHQNSGSSMTLTGNDKTVSCHQGLGCLLLMEHNFLCEAFIITTSCSGVHQYMRVLPSLLNSLNKIWTQMEWNYTYVHSAHGLCSLFSDRQFLKMVYHVVKFCEEELMGSRIEESDASDVFSVALLQSILPLSLRMLKCIHALWEVEVDVGLLSEELERAKSLSCMELASILESTDGLYNIYSEECFHENETSVLLEGTRHRVYNIIGLCTSVEGAFSELLDSVSVSDASINGLDCMEFRHLVKLIRLVVIPLVKHCPRTFWKERTVNFLRPILIQCEHRLHFAWFGLLYDWRSEKRYSYGNLVGLDEQIKELEEKLLLEFTREVSGLLRVLALTEQNHVLLHEDVVPDLDSMSSSSLLRILLLQDCLWWLKMSLFGYFVDDDAAIKVIPFCRSLIQLAVSINDVGLRLFIVDHLLPCLVRRLDNQLPCATQRLMHKLRSSASGSASEDLILLCEEIYDCFVKDSAGVGKDSSCAENNFTSWLAKRKEDLQVKARSVAKELPDGSDWNWEFEDEFQRYLPAYMEMVQQVDSMGDYEEYDDSSEKEVLFKKLAPEFKSKYGINSCVHPYMYTISSLHKQQFHSMCGILYQRKKGKFVRELIKLKPYIKASDCSSDIIDWLENSEIASEVPDSAVLPSLSFLLDILFLWEPVFHPMIRKSHMHILLWVVDQFAKANEREYCQLVPAARDFELHLQPYAYAFLETKLKENMYHKAIEQICLHKEFDSHLASGGLDHRMDEFIASKDDFIKDIAKDEVVTHKFSDLNRDLIKLSLERRAKIVEIQHQVCTYSDCLLNLIEDESLKGQIEVLMSELEKEGFFNTNNDSVNWEKQRFSELIDQFNHKVFAGHSLPKHYVIRGIIDYRLISMRKDSSELNAFEVVVDKVCERWIESCQVFWMEARYYDHLYYNIVRRPLEQVFTKKF